MEGMVEAVSGAIQSDRLGFRPVENNERDKDFIHEAILSDPVSYGEIEAGIKDSLLSLLIYLSLKDAIKSANAIPLLDIIYISTRNTL
ncbi:hypothetical protein PG995_003151 [Apiospora arundinis]